MSYRFDNLKLEKGMYNEAGRSFTQVLEREDPSEQYKGTALEGLDAYQRQLKRFDIKVKGAGSDPVEKFFATSQSAVLFPEYIARAVRQGMEESDLLPHISRSFFADSSYMLSFSVLCSCVCSRLISPSVSSWHKQDNTLMHQSPGHIQRRTPYNF